MAPKVFSVAGELVGRREKAEQWQRRQAGKIQRIFLRNFNDSLSKQLAML